MLFLKNNYNFFLKTLNLFIYLFLHSLAVLGLHCCTGFSPAVASGGYSLGAVCGPLTWWILLLWSTGRRACGLQLWLLVSRVQAQ